MVEQNFTTFLEYINEDKSKYPKASEKGYIDNDGDFLIGDSGGFLLNRDFIFVDTHKFRKMAIKFEEEGRYIDYESGTYEYNKIMKEEEYKRRYGVTENCKLLKKDIDRYKNAWDDKERNSLLKPLRISGKHYTFLNYGRIKRTDVVKGKIATKKVGFPRFFESQYWWYKVKEFAFLNGFNLVAAKSRRGGFSYMEAISCADEVNLNPKVCVALTAYDYDYLTEKEGAIATMTRDQLNFFEEYTPFNRCGFNSKGEPNGLLKKDLENMILGYKSSSGIPAGYLSSVISNSFGNKPDALIGKDAKLIIIEELSNAPNLFSFLDVTEPTLKAGGYKVGMFIGFGTGGSTEGNWVEFERLYYSLDYDCMPFENVWDNNMRHTTCGYFKPYIESLEGEIDGTPIIDDDGNTNYELAIKLSNLERTKAKKDKDNRGYIIFCGQYANKPSEAFNNPVSNLFVTDGLKEHYERLKRDTDLAFHQDGMLEETDKGKVVFKTNFILEAEGKQIHDYIDSFPIKRNQDVHGCIRIWYHPIKDEDGKIPENLYRISYDPFAIDKNIGDINVRDSLACIRVRMINNNIVPGGGDMTVASFVGRLNTTEEVDRICYLLCLYYNAKVLVEVNRGDTVKNFKKWKATKYLVKEPIHVWDKKIKQSVESSYGIVIGDSIKKLDGLSYIRDRLYKQRGTDDNGEPIYNYHVEYDKGYLEELLKFNLNSKLNFDRISAEIVSVYDEKELEFTKKNIILVEDKKKLKNSVFKRKWY